MLKGHRVLVTGATGQVARPIAEALNAENQVFAAARFSEPRAKQELEAQGIETVYFSMGEEDLSQLPEVDYVFHCGCNTNPSSPDEAMAQNAEGTGFLMQRYREVRAFLHMSSSSVYRVPASSREPVNEEEVLGGFSVYSPHYAMSKLAAEAVVRFQARALRLPTIITRLDVAYGTHGHGGVPIALFQMMKHGMSYTRSTAGESWCSPIHEDDIVEQVQKLIAHADVPAPIVNLGGDEVVSVEQMIAWIEELTGLSMKIDSAENASWGMKVLDNGRRRELAGPCHVSWKEGIRSAIEKRWPEALTT